MSIDTSLFEKINNLAGTSKVLDSLGIFFADYFQWILVAVLLLLFFWPKRNIIKNRIMDLSVIISVILSRLVITEPLKRLLHHGRPYVVLDTAKKLIGENGDYVSFPSGHAAIFFAMAMAIWFFNKKLGTWFFIGAILIGIARIFCGVHWPMDILAGAIIGILSAWIINKLFFKKYGHKIQNP